MTKWLSVIGIGDDGVAGLAPRSHELLDQAKTVIASKRILQNLQTSAHCETWPTPFDSLISYIENEAERPVVVLATGDPLWFSVGENLADAFSPEVLEFLTHPSCFQLAAAKMGWSMNSCTCLSIHGRPMELVAPHLAPRTRILVIGSDPRSAIKLSAFLVSRGYGGSKIFALSHLGGEEESIQSGTASNWSEETPSFHVLAVELMADENALILPKSGGLPDRAFSHDGRMTKQVVRAVTLAKLLPSRGALLWDIGAGCGSIAVEWMRSDITAKAIALEPREDRAKMISTNANSLGVPELKIVEGAAPEELATLPDPDAVFIGGGLTPETLEICQNRLNVLGRLVVNAVTLESEAILLKAHADFGGELVRIDVATADPVGQMTGWRPNMPVTQWSWIKR